MPRTSSRRIEGFAVIFAFEVARHTPPYVWAVAVLICWRSVQSLRTRWVSLVRLFLVPVIFVAVGIAGASLHSMDNLIGWAILAFVLVPTGYFTAPQPLAIDHAKRRMRIPRSLFTAIRVPAIFIIRYVLAVISAVQPARQAEIALATSLFSGAVVGYYLGWSLGLLQHYYFAPRTLEATDSTR
jgi:hypothetical protein